MSAFHHAIKIAKQCKLRVQLESDHDRGWQDGLDCAIWRLENDSAYTEPSWWREASIYVMGIGMCALGFAGGVGFMTWWGTG